MEDGHLAMAEQDHKLTIITERSICTDNPLVASRIIEELAEAAVYDALSFC